MMDRMGPTEQRILRVQVHRLMQFMTSSPGSAVMLGYAVAFMIIALIAGAMGFGLVGGMAYGAAKICFFVFLILAVVALLRGRSIGV